MASKRLKKLLGLVTNKEILSKKIKNKVKAKPKAKPKLNQKLNLMKKLQD